MYTYNYKLTTEQSSLIIDVPKDLNKLDIYKAEKYQNMFNGYKVFFNVQNTTNKSLKFFVKNSLLCVVSPKSDFSCQLPQNVFTDYMIECQIVQDDSVLILGANNEIIVTFTEWQGLGFNNNYNNNQLQRDYILNFEWEHIINNLQDAYISTGYPDTDKLWISKLIDRTGLQEQEVHTFVKYIKIYINDFAFGNAFHNDSTSWTAHPWDNNSFSSITVKVYIDDDNYLKFYPFFEYDNNSVNFFTSEESLNKNKGFVFYIKDKSYIIDINNNVQKITVEFNSQHGGLTEAMGSISQDTVNKLFNQNIYVGATNRMYANLSFFVY